MSEQFLWWSGEALEASDVSGIVGIPLPEDMRLCKQVKAQWLDTPDAPGFWACWHGDYRWVYSLEMLADDQGEMVLSYSDSGLPVIEDDSKWLRLNIPWPQDDES